MCVPQLDPSLQGVSAMFHFLVPVPMVQTRFMGQRHVPCIGGEEATYQSDAKNKDEHLEVRLTFDPEKDLSRLASVLGVPKSKGLALSCL